jgi:hypothetical protein
VPPDIHEAQAKACGYILITENGKQKTGFFKASPAAPESHPA